MSDVKEPSPTADLVELTTGTKSAKTPTLVDKTGKTWELLPLDLADVVDYEKHEGRSLFEEAFQDVKTPQLAYLMYLSLRKTGCSIADLDAKKYAFANDMAFMRQFDLKVFNRARPILDDLLVLSGLQVDEPASPQKADQ